jgi:hypothetical protein
MSVPIEQRYIYGDNRTDATQIRNPKCVWNTFKGNTAVPAAALRDSSYDYKLSWNSYNGVALTKRHVLFCQHWGGWDMKRPMGGEAGGKFKFVGPKNEQHWAVVAYDQPWGERVELTDLRIVQLAEDLPDWVEMGMLASDEQLQFLSDRYYSIGGTVPILCSPARRNRTLRISNGRVNASTVGRWYGIFKKDTDTTQRGYYYDDLTYGDSGTVQHILVDNQLIVIGNTTYGNNGGGNTVMRLHGEMQRLIDEMNAKHGVEGDYNLTTSTIPTSAIGQQLKKDHDYVTVRQTDEPVIIEPSPSLSNSPSPSLSDTPSGTPSPSPSNTPSPSFSNTPSPSVSNTPSGTPSPSVSNTPSSTPSPSVSGTPSPSPSNTPSKTPSSTPSVTPSAEVIDPVIIPSPLPTPTISQTPVITLPEEPKRGGFWGALKRAFRRLFKKKG